MRHATDVLVRDVQIARRNFFDGKLIPPGTVSELVARSWERAANSGLRPEDRALFSNFVTHGQLQRLEDEHRVLIEAAGEDMEILARAFPAQHWLVFCTNAAGMIVSASSRPAAAPAAAAAIRGGKQVCEAALGTNAPGCVLREGGMPVEIRRGEHYLNELVDVVCAAAPIYDCHDRLIGVLDVTGFGVDLPAYALSRVQAAAMSIENRLYARLPARRIVHLHHDHRMLHTPAEGIIAISDDDVIIAANRAARQMLGLRTGSGEGIDMRDVFAGGLHGGTGPAPGSLSARSGERFFVSLEQHARRHGTAAAKPAGGADCLIADATLARAFDKAVTVIGEQVPVILLGETGTGKSLLARALHDASRPGTAFVSLDCSSIPESLAEAELFGYADGAFTGSRKGGSIGKIEQANHGTLFLDEIGDMPLPLQTRLLSVLQERSLTRVGGSKPVPVDISVICATHRNLDQLVRQGSFRQDLFYRLNGMSVRMPALRERTDLPELIEAMMRSLARGRPKRLAADVMAVLMAHQWPGNIRELHQVLRAAMALSGGGELVQREHFDEGWLTVAAIGAPAAGVPPGGPDTHSTMLADMQSELIHRTLAALSGNRSQAARALGISRATLYRKLARSKSA
ncbi:Helix-turn-helix, Fis-type [Cupriavidus phytorum]|uniref:Helix-turn-helix, Fis-type n=2 Tax=Cupriavidus TaxID=106589 RepID=A0A375C224_9BURK|nr:MULTISPECIES: sigma-54-dependent Fis family transcriptional regulator [Cupriavidus]PZX20564.1 transcriptional regulator of acetoin/glycerol metabolism [Cupriavidus alkaliphilus]SOY61188.1 Helix-turn-helix, Fis-type [Cupriavidus taiwanensis]